MNVLDAPHAPRSPAHREPDKEKLQLYCFMRALRATWRIPLLATIILLIVTIALLVSVRAAFPPTRAYISHLQFIFPSAESGRYPNNAPFSINELLDPVILGIVYDQLELGKYEVDRNQFFGAFSIRPFTPAEAEIAERFRQQMSDRRLSAVERERLEQQMRGQIAQASRGAAELIFLPPRRPVLPVSVGRAIVHKVPLVWSQIAIEKKGVLRIPGFSAAASVIAPEAVDRQPLPLAILGLLEASERLDDRLTELLKAPGVLAVRDTASGKSIRDLERDIRDLQLFHTNPLRAQLVQHQYNGGGAELQQVVERRISDIDVRAAGLAKQAEAVGDSIAQYVQASAGLRGRTTERKAPEGSAAPGGTTIPQVGESFIDRIIELTRSDRDAEQDRRFIAERTQKQFEYNQRAIELRSEQDRWKELLADLRSDAAARKDLDEATRGRIAQQIRYAIEDANAKWAAMSRMEAEFAASRTGRTAEIYAPSSAYRDVASSDLVLNMTVLGAVAYGLIFFFLAFWAIRALIVLIRG
jgi:hypothetical protein